MKETRLLEGKYSRTCFEGSLRFTMEMAVNDRCPLQRRGQRNVKSKYCQKEMILKSGLTIEVTVQTSDSK